MIAERSPDQDQGSQEEGVCLDDPLNFGGSCIQLRLEHRQCYVDDCAIDQAKQHFGKIASAYITQPLTASSDLSLFEDVVKERRLTMIACFGQANLVFG